MNTTHKETIHQIHRIVDANMKKINQLLEENSQRKKLTTVMHQIERIRRTYLSYKEEIIWKYDPKYELQFTKCNCNHSQINELAPINFGQFRQQISLKDGFLPYLIVECRNNWINQYLDKPQIQVFMQYDGKPIRIMSQTKGEVIIQEMKSQDKKFQTIELTKLYNQNHKGYVNFVENRYRYSFSNKLIKLVNNTKRLYIIKLSHQKQKNIRRILIFKENSAQSGDYKFLKGFYESYDGFFDIQLEPASYIFMTVSGTEFQLYTTQQIPHYIFEAEREPIKQFNLMLQGFQQCHPHQINSEFMRVSDFQSGIIIEVYRNPLEDEIYFIDKEKKEEDKTRMFAQLYSERMINYRLKRGETIVTFYELTKKPALVFIPKKQVYVGQQLDDKAITVHSVLK